MNRQTLIGNLCDTAKTHETQTGKTVTSFRMATNERIGDKSFSEFHNVVCWGNRGPALLRAGHLSKGNEVLVEGRTQHRSYDGQDGNKRYVTEVVMSEFRPLRRPSGTSSPAPQDVPPPSDEDYDG